VGHGKSVDWYLLGLLIYEMLTGVVPFYVADVERFHDNVLYKKLSFPTHIRPVAKNLI